MKTTEELRLELEKQGEAKEIEQKRLQEEVMVANLTFPPDMQQALGASGIWIKLEELPAYLEEEFDNDNFGVFTIKLKRKTNKWIESLPEADY